MLQQDYIMRLIQEFAAALRKFLQKPEGEDKDTMLRDLYRQYVGDYEFYHTAATEDALASMEQYDERERTHRIEMLVELYYAEGSLCLGADRLMLWDKAFRLFDYVNRHGKTFSFDRMAKMEEITKALK